MLKNYEDPWIIAKKDGSIQVLLSFTRSNATALIEAREELYEGLKEGLKPMYEQMYAQLCVDNTETALDQRWRKYIIFQKAHFVVHASA